MSPVEILLPLAWVDDSQILHPYWKSPLCIKNRDDTTTVTTACGDNLAYLYPTHNSFQRIYEEWDTH